MRRCVCDRCGKEFILNMYWDPPCIAVVRTNNQAINFDLCKDCGDQVLTMLKTNPNDYRINYSTSFRGRLMIPPESDIQRTTIRPDKVSDDGGAV